MQPNSQQHTLDSAATRPVTAWGKRDERRWSKLRERLTT
jgi:hypothetical protein